MVYRDALQDVECEIDIMKKLNHLNIIRLHEVIKDDDNDKLYMVIDYAEHGQIMNFDENTRKWTPYDKRK